MSGDDIIEERKIQHYTLIRHHNTGEFIDQINHNLKGGWELYGNTFVDDESYYQAMVKYEGPNKKALKDVLEEYIYHNKKDLEVKECTLNQRGIGYAEGVIDCCKHLLEYFDL